MISKNKIKLFSQLHQKKYRNLYNLFIAEGDKTIDELLRSKIKAESILVLKGNKYLDLIKKEDKNKVHEIDYNVIKRISSFKTPQPILGIFHIPGYNFNLKDIEKNLVLILDDIQDPGNLGTIIRIADWFGINNIICSNKSVDVFNPKVVQASMGSISRVRVFYKNLPEILKSTKLDVYGMYLEGENIYTCDFKKRGYIVLGNESKGINPDLDKYISKKILIPSISKRNNTIDSLNISVAAGIVCSEIRRKSYSK